MGTEVREQAFGRIRSKALPRYWLRSLGTYDKEKVVVQNSCFIGSTLACFKMGESRKLLMLFAPLRGVYIPLDV